VLVTCSCSHHLAESQFAELLWEAAADVGEPLHVVERRTQSRDHPVLIGVAETYYLKVFILRTL
jgi:23S rRNA (cytosine1962-C5)-methyltransferase